jgi:hypothetical protein
MVNEYWVARRGMAYGVLCGAGGVSGAVMRFVVQTLLDNYGYQKTLRIVAVGLAILTILLLPFFKDRLPSSDQTISPRIDWSILQEPYVLAVLPIKFVPGFRILLSCSIPTIIRDISRPHGKVWRYSTRYHELVLGCWATHVRLLVRSPGVGRCPRVHIYCRGRSCIILYVEAGQLHANPRWLCNIVRLLRLWIYCSLGTNEHRNYRRCDIRPDRLQPSQSG